MRMKDSSIKEHAANEGDVEALGLQSILKLAKAEAQIVLTSWARSRN